MTYLKWFDIGKATSAGLCHAWEQLSGAPNENIVQKNIVFLNVF